MTTSEQPRISLSVVLPAFNEQDSLPVTLANAFERLPGLVPSFEVIVVDDGSTDDTAAVLLGQLGIYGPRLRVLRHRTNEGYGAALGTGFAIATGELVFYTDADNQFDLGDLEDFLPLLADADVAVGYRARRSDSWLRSFTSRGYNVLVRLAFQVGVRDIDCSYKLFTRQALDQIEVESSDFFVDTELVVKARKLGLRVVEHSVAHYPRYAGETTVAPGDVPRTLWTMVRMWRRLSFPRHGVVRRSERAAPHAVDEVLV